ncbi:hypothetical protein [Photorhabdus luminescens]|uniref:Uncharacterized protein n=1 Tax=Photorhabdus luminescens subsp. mexicana TaxID=2100167 RepID=A0A4R4ITX5_PHOLU|nr:hypothetical protein [Photorhabdus luminescens]TDB44156.1 hypothetical protein C5468_22935 [Photorhabdus luminescens subsp. mexicana]
MGTTITNAIVKTVTVQKGPSGLGRKVTIDKLPGVDLYFSAPVQMASDLLNVLCLDKPVDLTFDVINEGQKNERKEITSATVIIST